MLRKLVQYCKPNCKPIFNCGSVLMSIPDEEVSRNQIKRIKAKMSDLGYSDRQVIVIEVNNEEPIDFIVILRSL